MSVGTSMLNGIFSLIGDFLTGIFAFIPQMMYFVYTCAASVLDFLQFVVRKLAGLDVYYVDGTAVQGDIVLNIVKGILGIPGETGASYSTLSTVFWSVVLFGVVILVLATIIKVIISHYNYDSDKSNPMRIIRSSIKSLMTMAIIPIVTVFGIQISNALLKTLDQITGNGGATAVAGVYESSAGDYNNVFKAGEDSWGNQAYASYDFFGFGAYTNSTPISGHLFMVAASECNRVRKGSFTAEQGGSSWRWSEIGIFNSTTADAAQRTEEVSYMIDFAFANNLTLNKRATASVLRVESLSLISSYRFFQSAVWYVGTIAFKSFSKFNVGLVWYYYNLWGFNFFMAFVGLGLTLTLLINIIFGLISRIIMILALFLVYPALVGIGPLDDNRALGSWRQEFVGNVLMCYGSIIGMNLCFMILPILQGISFFNSRLVDTVFNMVIVIAALLSIKRVIAVFSQMIGAKDAQAEGEAIKNEATQTAMAAAEKVMKVAKFAATIVASVYSGGAAMAAQLAKEAAIKKAKQEAIKKIKEKMQKKMNEKLKKKNTEEAEKLKKDQEKEKKEEEQEEKKDQQNNTEGEDATGTNEGGGDTNADTSGVTNNQNNKPDENKQDGQGQDDNKQEQQDEKQDGGQEDEEDKMADKAEDFMEGLDDDKYDTGKLGDDKEAGDKARDWYNNTLDERRKLREKEKGGKLTKAEDEELRKQTKNEAVDKFLGLSSTVQKMAQAQGEKNYSNKRIVKGVRKLKKTGGKVKNKLASAAKKLVKDKDGNTRPFVAITAESLKTVGHLLGISTTLKKQLGDAGVTDAFYESMQGFGQALGMSTKNFPKTKKQKEDEEKEDATAEQRGVGKINSYSDAVLKQLLEIKKLNDRMDQEHKSKVEEEKKNKPKK